jgi:RHS repeat-associated protein
MVSSSPSARGAARVALAVALAGIALVALAPPSIPSAPAPAAAVFPPGDTTTIYGPVQLSTPNGNATNHVERFAVAVTPGQRYTLRLVNGAPNGSARVTAGTVQLNGWETMTSADLASGATLDRVIQVRNEDTLFATVQGSAGAYVTVSVLATPDASFLVFGPAHFIRTTGTPVTETRTFSISPTAAPPYRFCLTNGGEDGSNRVSSASIVLNHQEVFTQSQFNQHVASLMAQVTLQPANTLQVTLSGIPGGFLDLCVTATDTTPPVLAITAPPQNLITRDTLVTVSGTVQDETPTTVTVDGQAVAVTGGAFSRAVPLTAEGPKTIHVIATDAAGHTTDSTRTVTRDRTPPVLTVNQPVNGFITNQASLAVSGTVTDANAVTVNVNGTPLTVSGTTFGGSFLLAEGTNVLVFTAIDAANNETPVMRTVKLDTQAPVIALNSPAEGDTIATDSATLVGTVTDANPKTLTANGIAIPLGQNGSFTGKVPLVVGPNTITLVATDSASNNSAPFVRHVVRRNPLPPDPATVATAINPVEATLIKENTSFLYTGTSPIQTGVDTAAIQFLRAAVVRGRVLDRQLQPLGGAVVKIRSHPEFGQTLSRADGGYDLVVNGGGSLVLDYSKGGYLPAQRTVEVPWQDYTPVEDVILVQPDPVVTVVDLTAPGITVARGSVQTDADGARQATVFFEEGTKAALKHPNGTIDTLTTLNVRATEFTVGENGEEAMPGELPPSSQYTYAVQVTADQQIGEPGATLTFTKPVPVYVENFLDLDSLKTVPVGVYNPDSAKWLPRPNGLMVKVTGTNAQGQALLDINGDGIADSDSLLLFNGIDPVERVKLAGTYPLNSRLWRVPIIEGLPHDLNWPFTLLGGTEPKTRITGPCGSEGADVLRCNLQAQTAFQSVGLVGSPFTLNYASDRTKGNVADRSLDIQLVGATVPAFLERVDLEVTIAGRLFETSFTPTANLTYHFVWDGKDAYGRTVQATQPATVKVGYLYPVIYSKPASGSQSFGAPCNVTTGSCTVAAVPPAEADVRALRRIWEGTETTLGGIDAAGLGLGGFTLDVQHAYDPLGGILYNGDGTRRVAATLPDQITRWAGNGNSGGAQTPAVNGKHRLAAQIDNPTGILVAPDGSVILSEPFRGRVLKISPNDTISTVAGLPTGPIADSGTATALKILGPQGIAMGPDGSVYFAEQNGHRIRQVTPQGFMRTIAGDGTCGFLGDTGLAKAARICQPTGLGIAPDGSIYFADQGNLRIRRIGPDRRISTVAGFGTVSQCFEAGSGSWPPPPPSDFITICKEGVPSTQAPLRLIQALTVGPDGSVYFSQGQGGKFDPRIRKIDPSGIIRTVVGSDHGSPPVPLTNGDGGAALQSRLTSVWAIAIGPDGSLYFADEGPEQLVGGVPQPGTGQTRVRRVRPDGLIQTVVGDGVNGNTGDNGPARRARIQRVEGIAFLSDGSLLISDDAKVRKVSPPLPGLAGGQQVVASRDGSQLYVFSPAGRILLTLHPMTGDTMYRFGYNEARQLVSVRDRRGQTTTIQRDDVGRVTGVVSPDGYQTSLQVDPNGALQSVTDPSGNKAQLGFDANGLASSATDPNGAQSLYAFDSTGRLTRVTDPDSSSLSRSLTAPSALTLTTSSGSVATISSEQTPTGDMIQTGTLATGSVIQSTNTGDDATVTHATDGTVYTITRTPDPRFGMQVPLEQVEARLPNGLRRTTRHVRRVTLSDSLNLLSLTTQVDSLFINGQADVQTYDRALRRLTTRTRAGRVRFSFLDSVTQRVRDSMPGVLARRYTFDAGGRLTQVVQGARTVQAFFGSDGLQDSSRNELGFVTHRRYDSAGRLTQRVGPSADTVRWEYDSAGNNTAVTPPGRPAHRFTYNFRRNLASYRPPPVVGESSAVFWQYGDDGRVSQILRPDGQNVSFGYDSSGQLSSTVFGQDTVRRSHDPTTGRLVGVQAPAGVNLTQTYDGALLTQRSWTGPVAGTVTAQYDSGFRVASLLVNASPAITYGYDADGAITSAGGLTVGRDSPTGKVVSTSVGQVTSTIVRDAFGDDSVVTAQVGAAVLVRWVYTRDNAGRVTGATETINGVSSTLAYTYDSIGRLSLVVRDGVPTAAYGYDRNANRLSATYASGSVSATYDVQDRIITYGSAQYKYSPAGSVSEKTVGSDTTRYTFDGLGQLRSVRLPNGTVVSYLYDGGGRRVGKRINGTLVQGFLYGGDRHPVAELDGSGVVVRQFVYGTRPDVPDLILQGGTTYRIIADPVGSVRFVVNTQSGALVQQVDYDAFGRVIQNSAPNVQPFGFAGGIVDSEVGLVQLGLRFYESETGRWISRDPILFDGATPNLYSYAGSDPINASDRTGTIFAFLTLQMDAEIEASEKDQDYKRVKRTLEYGAACVNGIIDVMFDHGNWGGGAGFIGCAKEVGKELLWSSTEDFLGIDGIKTFGLRIAYDCLFDRGEDNIESRVGSLANRVLGVEDNDPDHWLIETGYACIGGAVGQGLSLLAFSKNRMYGPIIRAYTKVLFHVSEKFAESAIDRDLKQATSP